MGGKRGKREPNVNRPDERREIYGYNASVVRNSLKLTQGAIAKRAGLSRGAYVAFENGVSNTQLLHVMAMADALGVPLSVILSDTRIKLDSSQ